jgi:AcrR family transcriptional regulator
MRVTGVRSEVSAKWESRYREVLDAAAIAFAENGYLGASTRDIAERLGIRAASLYYYLPSKEAALLAICKLGVLDFIDNLKDIIARRDPAPENCEPRSPITFCHCAAILPPITFAFSSCTGTSCRMGHARKSDGWHGRIRD